MDGGVLIALVPEVNSIKATWMVQLPVEPRTPVGVSTLEFFLVQKCGSHFNKSTVMA